MSYIHFNIILPLKNSLGILLFRSGIPNEFFQFLMYPVRAIVSAHLLPLSLITAIILSLYR